MGSTVGLGSVKTVYSGQTSISNNDKPKILGQDQNGNSLAKLSPRELTKLSQELHKVSDGEWSSLLKNISDLEISLEREFVKKNSNAADFANTKDSREASEEDKKEALSKLKHILPGIYQIKDKIAALREVQSKILEDPILRGKVKKHCGDILEKEMSVTKNKLLNVSKKNEEFNSKNQIGREERNKFTKFHRLHQFNPTEVSEDQLKQSAREIKRERLNLKERFDEIYKGINYSDFKCGLELSPFITKIAVENNKNLQQDVEKLLDQVSKEQKQAYVNFNNMKLNVTSATTVAEILVEPGGTRPTDPAFMKEALYLVETMVCYRPEIKRTEYQKKEMSSPVNVYKEKMDITVIDRLKKVSKSSQNPTINFVDKASTTLVGNESAVNKKGGTRSGKKTGGFRNVFKGMSFKFRMPNPFTKRNANKALSGFKSGLQSAWNKTGLQSAWRSMKLFFNPAPDFSARTMELMKRDSGSYQELSHSRSNSSSSN